MRALAAVAGLVLAAGAARAEPTLCRASVVLDAKRAFVGQPVLHRVRFEQRLEVVDLRWETSLSFPAFRAERLLAPTGPPEQGETTVTTEERRVLFPARAGRLALPAARIVCESATRVESAEVPPRELLVLEPPVEGRPPDWVGLIGPVEVTRYATPDRVALGESVSIAVTVHGPTNVWAAPVAFAFPPDVAELFERPPELSREMGRSLVLRSYRAFDLVPRRAGVLELPELRVAYFDPGHRRYEEARAPALSIEVSGRAAAAELPPPETSLPAESAAAGEGRGGLAGAGLALAVGLGAGFWLGRHGWPRRRGAAARAAAGEEERTRTALGAALAQGDAGAAAAAAALALRLELERARPGARTLAVEELATSGPPGHEATVHLLARLERARFAGGAPAELLALAREVEAAR